MPSIPRGGASRSSARRVAASRGRPPRKTVAVASARRDAPASPLATSDEKASTSARRAILDAAVEALEHRGESTIRISQIARKAGVAVGLIYYHFSDREGLVSAAQIERMLRTPSDDVNLLDAAVRLADEPEQFAKMIARIVCAAIARDRAAMRLDRVAILGASKGRPTFTASLARALSSQTDRLASIVAAAKERGMVDPSVDARAFAILVQALSVGMVVADLDETPTPRRLVLDVFLRSLVGFMGPAATMLVPTPPAAERKRAAGATSRRAR